MSEETEEETIVITGRRLSISGGTGTGGGFGAPTITETYVPQPAPEDHEQEGGGETITTARFSMVDGDLVVRLPGYDFPIRVPAASWGKMSADQKGAFLKLMTEYSQSPELVSFLNHLQTQGASW